MRLIKIFFYFFITLSLLFTVVVFFSNIDPFALEKKRYLTTLIKLREGFNQEIKQKEKITHEKFITDNFNRSIIDNIIDRRTSFSGNFKIPEPLGLNNFVVVNNQKRILYQIRPQVWFEDLIPYLNLKQKKTIVDKDRVVFQFPYEKNSRRYLLLFEYGVYRLLENSFVQIFRNSPGNLIRFPELVILEEGPDDHYEKNFKKTTIQNSLSQCSAYEKICQIYFPSLQKTLLIDHKSYMGLSSGILYRSNPLDMPKESIQVFIALISLITLTGNIILIGNRINRKRKKKTEEHSDPVDPRKTLFTPETNDQEGDLSRFIQDRRETFEEGPPPQ